MDTGDRLLGMGRLEEGGNISVSKVLMHPIKEEKNHTTSSAKPPSCLPAAEEWCLELYASHRALLADRLDLGATLHCWTVSATTGQYGLNPSVHEHHKAALMYAQEEPPSDTCKHTHTF